MSKPKRLASKATWTWRCIRFLPVERRRMRLLPRRGLPPVLPAAAVDVVVAVQVAAAVELAVPAVPAAAAVVLRPVAVLLLRLSNSDREFVCIRGWDWHQFHPHFVGG